MAVLNFPDNSQINDQYTGDNGITYIFDGVKWVGRAVAQPAGTNSITNNGNTLQIDPVGNIVIPTGAHIYYESGQPLAEAQGPAGPGVAVGGTAGQVLAKVDSTDYNTEWVNPSGGGGTGEFTPATPADWTGSPTVGTVVSALDELAYRVHTVETSGVIASANQLTTSSGATITLNDSGIFGNQLEVSTGTFLTFDDPNSNQPLALIGIQSNSNFPEQNTSTLFLSLADPIAIAGTGLNLSEAGFFNNTSGNSSITIGYTGEYIWSGRAGTTGTVLITTGAGPSSYTWAFNPDGTLALPGGGTISTIQSTNVYKNVANSATSTTTSTDFLLGSNEGIVFDLLPFDETSTSSSAIKIIDSQNDGYANTGTTLNVGRIYHSYGNMVIESDGSVFTNTDATTVFDSYGQLILKNLDGSAGIIINQPLDAYQINSDSGTVKISTVNSQTSMDWVFDQVGKFKLPLGGDIVDSNGNSVLGSTGSGNVFSTSTINLHNGGDQQAQTLQFNDSTLQSVITGPAAVLDQNAQRLIIQGQRGNGQYSEGGDVYVWAGDAETDGGDIKVYAGDADSQTEGYGGYVNLAGGRGYNTGGQVFLQGGQGTITGGNVRIRAGYGATQSGNVTIENANSSNWVFGADDDLALPGGLVFDRNNTSIRVGMGFHIASGEGISLDAIDNNDPNNLIYKSWQFGTDGTLVLPGSGQVRDVAGTSSYQGGVTISAAQFTSFASPGGPGATINSDNSFTNVGWQYVLFTDQTLYDAVVAQIGWGNGVFPITWSPGSTLITGYVLIQFVSGDSFQICPVVDAGAGSNTPVDGTWFFDANLGATLVVEPGYTSITKNGVDWKFGDDGTLQLPTNGKIVGSYSTGFALNAITLVPNNSSEFITAGQYLNIYPTIGQDVPHIHIAAGTGGDLILGPDFASNVEINHDESVKINASMSQWVFSPTSDLSIPGIIKDGSGYGVASLDLRENQIALMSTTGTNWLFGADGSTQFPNNAILAPINQSITMQSDQYTQLMWMNADQTPGADKQTNSDFYVESGNATLDIGYRDSIGEQKYKSWYWNADGSFILPNGSALYDIPDSSDATGGVSLTVNGNLTQFDTDGKTYIPNDLIIRYGGIRFPDDSHQTTAWTGTTFMSALGDVNLTTPPTDGQILKWSDTYSQWAPANDIGSGAGGGVTFGDLSASVNNVPAGNGNLTYSSVSGQFTYTPPDLSAFLTTSTLSGYATETYVTSQGFVTTSSVSTLIADSLTNYVTSSTLSSSLGSYATTDAVSTLIANSLTNYVTSSTLSTTLGSYATTSYVTGQGYTTTASVSTLIVSSLTNFVTSSTLSSKGYITSSSISVTQLTPATTGSLSYSTSTGVFSFTPTAPYVLTTASSSVLGGVKIGSGLAVSGDGTVSTLQTLSTTSNVTFNNVVTTGQVIESFQTVSTAINTGTTINCSTGNIINVTSTATSNWAAALTNVAVTANQATNITMILNQGVTAYVPSSLSINGTSVTINWQGGSIPTGNPSKKDVVAFSVLQTGASTYLVFGQLVTFG